MGFLHYFLGISFSSILANLPLILGWVSANAFLHAYWTKTKSKLTHTNVPILLLSMHYGHNLERANKERGRNRWITVLINEYLNFSTEIPLRLLIPVSWELLPTVFSNVVTRKWWLTEGRSSMASMSVSKSLSRKTQVRHVHTPSV